jgi:hypothetical protein
VNRFSVFFSFPFSWLPRRDSNLGTLVIGRPIDEVGKLRHNYELPPIIIPITKVLAFWDSGGAPARAFREPTRSARARSGRKPSSRVSQAR